MIPTSVLFVLLLNACSYGNVYQCLDKTGMQGKNFALNSKEVTINRFQSFPFSLKNVKQRIRRNTLYMDNDWPQVDTKETVLLYEHHDPLIPQSGAYKVTKQEKEVAVSFVLEDIISVSQLPSGQLVETVHDRSWYDRLYRFGEYKQWTSFLVQVFMVKQYIFHTQENTLAMLIYYPFPPQRGEKVNWTFYNEIRPKYAGSMTSKELDTIFQFHQNREKFYPSCERLKGFYLFLYYTMPIWGWLAYLT